MSVVLKLFTQKFLAKILLAVADDLSKKSTNKIDDKIVKGLKDALE